MARSSPVALSSTLRTTVAHREGSQLWALFLGFRDISWPSQALHPSPANFLARALGCGGMEGCSPLGLVHAALRGKERTISHSGGREEWSETSLEECGNVGAHRRVSSEPALQSHAKPPSPRCLASQSRVLADLTPQPICQAWLQMTLGCSKNQNLSRS